MEKSKKARLTTRRALFAQLFKGLGHQMHLVQDMAVPAHVRNDAHAEESMQGDERWYVNMLVRKGPLYFETWAKRNPEIINGFAADPVGPALNFDSAYADTHGGPATCPVSQLWDSDFYNYTNDSPSATTAQGLAEYTNANFYSEDTLFAAEKLSPGDKHYFPYPDQDSLNMDDYLSGLDMPEEVWAEDGTRDYRCYIAKTGGGETVDHFVAVGYFSAYFKQPDNEHSLFKTMFLDEACHRDYAEKLVPRAVGYSAALLDYFFRGALQIRKPFVRFGVDANGLAISGFEFDARNISAINGHEEQLGSGALTLAYRYIPHGQTEPVYGLVEADHIFSIPDQPYAIMDADDPINNDFVHLRAEIAAASYIPIDAEELSFTLVFSGTLGAERNNALAVGSHRFDEAFVNRTTRLAYTILLDRYDVTRWHQSNIHTLLPDGDDRRNLTGLDEAPRTSGEVTRYIEPAWSPDGRLMAFTREYCPALEHDAYDPEIIGCDMDDQTSDIIVVDMTAGAVDADHPLTILTWPATNYPEGTQDMPSARLLGASFAPDNRHLVCMIRNPWTISSALQSTDLAVLDVLRGDGVQINGFQDNSCLPCKGYWWNKDLLGALPAWSPDGRSIAYYLHRESNIVEDTQPMDIYTIDPTIYSLDDALQRVDGTDDTALTIDPALETQATWSPDSQWLAFVSNRDGQDMDLWIMDRNGGNMQRIYDGPTEIWAPCFSPDGMRIAFRMGDSICTVDLSGTDMRQVYGIGNSTDQLQNLTWSPYLDDYAPEVTLSVDATTITAGQSVTLTWSSTDADRIVIDNGIGEQTAMSDQLVVTPGRNHHLYGHGLQLGRQGHGECERDGVLRGELAFDPRCDI